MADNYNQEDKFLKDSGLEHIREVATIMPTMIDDSVDDEKEIKRDISAIIPKFEKIEDNDYSKLSSKDEMLKSDGSVVIATIDDSGNLIYKANFVMPEQIDIQARKEEQIKEKNKKKKKEKVKPSKIAKKQQNIVAFVAFLTISGLIGFYMFLKKAPKDTDFRPINITLELGEKLPIRTKYYVEPGVGNKVDELQYIKDTSKVVVENVGEYEFSITYKEITKYGTVTIQDTTKPNLKTRDLVIVEGLPYTASNFVDSCQDYSGCNFDFQNSDTPQKYTSPGTYTVYIIATDAYGNTISKKANLVIQHQGIVKTFKKETPFDFETGYSLKEEYELNFADYANDTMLLSGLYTQTFKYEDEEKYQAARKTYNGEPNYQCLDHEKQIVFVKTVGTIGGSYSKLSDILLYFENNGFIEIIE